MYIGFFDKDTGKKITCYAEGIHYEEENKDEVIKRFIDENKNAIAVNLSEDEFKQQLNGNLLYKDGHLVAEEVVTDDEDDDDIAAVEPVAAKSDVMTNAELTAAVKSLMMAMSEEGVEE